MSVEWSYFNRFEWADEKYLPQQGEGETMATQVVTAVSKLVYKWYNDGDVYDNTHFLNGWCNDLSSYANWIAKYLSDFDFKNDNCESRLAVNVLYCIFDARTDDDYEDILKTLCDNTHDKEFLEMLDKIPKQGSIYECDGSFKFIN